MAALSSINATKAPAMMPRYARNGLRDRRGFLKRRIWDTTIAAAVALFNVAWARNANVYLGANKPVTSG